MKLKIRYLATNFIFHRIFSVFSIVVYNFFLEYLISLFPTSSHSFCSSRPSHSCFFIFIFRPRLSSIAFTFQIQPPYSQSVAPFLHISPFLAFIRYHTKYFQLVHLAILNLYSLNGFPQSFMLCPFKIFLFLRCQILTCSVIFKDPYMIPFCQSTREQNTNKRECALYFYHIQF